MLLVEFLGHFVDFADQPRHKLAILVSFLEHHLIPRHFLVAGLDFHC